jgi:hypothetical protein
MRSCTGAISAFGVVVKMVNERVTVSSDQRERSPSQTIG